MQAAILNPAKIEITVLYYIPAKLICVQTSEKAYICADVCKHYPKNPCVKGSFCMKHKAADQRFIPLCSIMEKTAKRVRAMKRIYRDLCNSGAAEEPEAFFADNFHSILSCAGSKGESEKSRRMIYFDNGFELAEAIIRASDDRFPDTDDILWILRDKLSSRRVFGSELEYLRQELIYTLTENIYSCLISRDLSLIRYMTLLSDLGSIDMQKINDVLNPVAIKLSKDPAYCESDPKTRLAYREAIYKTAEKFGIDEQKLCTELFEKYSPGCLEIGSLEVLKHSKLPPKSALIPFFGMMLLSAAISLAIAFWADLPLAALILFLPATEALRPLFDYILTKNRRVCRLFRLDPSSETVVSTKTAIVLSAAVFGPEDAVGLYDRLLRLHCLNPADNITICALLDLSAEQVPVTSEDRAVIDSLTETVERLEKTAHNKFCCIVRKRSFSETQQEYTGALRKRGALTELAKYMKTGENDFYAMAGCCEKLKGIDYICAVDSDTRPLMDSVNELLAIALHPANRVEVKNGFVTRGFGIIAPRMVTRLGDSLSSEFSKSLGGIGSRSSYDEESANLWQDVFSRGTFCGKGLINVTALFECTKDLGGERILSHDILEGELLKTAYAGDVIFTEGFPKNPQSYYRRLDRWIRGDFQNIPEIFSKRFDTVAKLKLSDNLRRAAVAPSVFTAFLIGFILPPVSSAIIAGAALALWLAPSLLGTVFAVFSDRSFGRRFYSGLLSSASQSARYILYSTIMLPTLAVKSVRAIFTALIRLVTRRKLLEWTTSDTQDRTAKNPLGFYILPELLSLSLLWSPDYFIRLFGAIFSAMPALLLLDDAKAPSSEQSIKYRDLRDISKQLADMWGFFENYVTRSDNDLPPDNVQFSPVYRIAHRTSPTNIGLYLLSVLAAYDRKLINRSVMLEKLTRTLRTVLRLEKYRGNLYNWYDTKTLRICPKPYVSSVDSGNFVCCLVALKEGVAELETSDETKTIIQMLEKLIDETDLSCFYDPVRGLMAIGLDPEEGRGRAHYDYLMSEARLTSFWAIASRQVPKSHWQRLSRAMLRCGFFGGTASYSGTMFEYFMPEIFLKSPEGSLFNESLGYALYVQKKYAKALGRPYGISESGYFSFDSALNYRYCAHGVPNTGMRRGLEQTYVVSPYSTYISLGYSGNEGPENLRKLASLGMYGTFGLYEALDYTSEPSGKPEPVRSYMAHHVGMSILACDNLLGGGIIQKRFMRDLRVRGALELLDERFHLGAAVFENDLRRPHYQAPPPQKSETEVMTEFSLSEPRIKLISNGELTLMAADNGVCASLYRSKNVYLRTRDLLTRPKGIFCFVSDGGSAFSLSYLPDKADGLCVEFSDDSATYYRSSEKLSAGMKLRLHSDMPCELRTFALKNNTPEPLETSVICYIEPSLQDTAAEQAHPAFSKMFLRLERDPRLDYVSVSRVREEKQIYLGAGFVEDVLRTVSFNREEVLERTDGVSGLGERFKDIPPSLISEPDPCVYLRADIKLPPKAETELTMFLVCADSKEELLNRVCEIRRKKPKFCAQPALDTAEGRVASMLLPRLLFDTAMPKHRLEAVVENDLPLRALWELSLSTDLPIVLVALNGRNDSQKLSAYLRAYKLLRLCGAELSLVFSFDDGGRYERQHYTDLISAARAEGLESAVYSGGGILPLDLSKIRDGLYQLLKAASCHICTDEIVPPPEEVKTKSYAPIIKSRPIPQKVEFKVACGGFNGESYVINEKPPLPWCHILSNQVFGTLLSDSSLGFSFAFNSRENRLTPWDNDPERDNSGERLLLRKDGKFYDLINGAAAVFSPYKAEYYSRGDCYECKTTVTVSAKGLCKKIDVDLKLSGKGDVCYYTEPCMGFSREHSAMIVPKRRKNGITFFSPASELSGYMSVSASCECFATTDRDSFLQGLCDESCKPSGDICGAVWCEADRKISLSFYLSYALDRTAAERMPEFFDTQTDTREHIDLIKTDDKSASVMANTWLRYQALHARIWARTGFWQCSGAYGFRDQLQDAVGICPENPNILKTQILRCCGAQFKQGDVMHWWHCLPNQKPKGLRTRISDDALWLPYAVCEYVKNTGDESLLWLKAPYCDGISLSPGLSEIYGEVYKTALRETVYEHCRRAVDFRMGKTGRHGLMLIGTGDWNDGFGNVGKGGEGESVWLTEFYIIVLKRFSKIAEKSGDAEYAKTLSDYSEKLSEAVEFSGRESDRYLRGFFDDGSLLGSAKNSECRIDSIAQSFAQFADLGQKDGFSKTALLCAFSELCDISRGVIKLFTPAFSDNADPDPGYVKSYPDGLRENGGQYTHAAVWFGMACLRAGLKEEGSAILSAINPVNRSLDGGYLKYKTEPYYLCGDVYSNKNCRGRGGWSIYTGSAAWYYRALRELFENGKKTGEPI